MAISIIQNPVPLVLVDSKGDMFIATGDDTVGKLSVGAVGTVLTADPNEAAGVKWAPAASGGFDTFLLMG
jgi:hypothetical protein